MTLGLRKDFLGNNKVLINKEILNVLKLCIVKNHHKKRGGSHILGKDICSHIADRELVPDYIYCPSLDLIKVNKINV